MNLSFKEQKVVFNFVLWFLKYDVKCKVVIVFGRPVGLYVCIKELESITPKCVLTWGREVDLSIDLPLSCS